MQAEANIARQTLYPTTFLHILVSLHSTIESFGTAKCSRKRNVKQDKISIDLTIILLFNTLMIDLDSENRILNFALGIGGIVSV